MSWPVVGPDSALSVEESREVYPQGNQRHPRDAEAVELADYRPDSVPPPQDDAWELVGYAEDSAGRAASCAFFRSRCRGWLAIASRSIGSLVPFAPDVSSASRHGLWENL